MNLGFYLQEVLKSIPQRCWKKAPTFTAPNTHARDPLWSLDFIFSITTLKYQWKIRPGHKVSFRLWQVQRFQLKWLEAGSETAPPSPCWVMAFLKTVQGPSVVPILLVKLWPSNQVPMGISKSSVQLNHIIRKGTLTALINTGDRLQGHRNIPLRLWEEWVVDHASFVMLDPVESPLISLKYAPIYYRPNLHWPPGFSNNSAFIFMKDFATGLHIYYIDSAIEWIESETPSASVTSSLSASQTMIEHRARSLS